MKLKNKKTGEIIDLNKGSITDVGFGSKIQLQATDRYNKPIWVYDSLAELNEEWEDYEETKEDYIRVIESFILYVEEADDSFFCDESVKKFVEKLKAWKRLKEHGFKFTGWDRHPDFVGDFRITASDDWNCDDKDLDLLFGGEE